MRPLTPYDGLNGLDFLLAAVLVVAVMQVPRVCRWAMRCLSEREGL
jgi:hypothetical protein